MVGVVVMAHGGVATALVDAAGSIAGPLHGVEALDLPPGAGPEALRATLDRAVTAQDRGRGVVVLVDLVGGTPANCCLGLLEQERVEVVAGVNLPMLLRLSIAQDRAADAKSLAAELVEHGSKNIVDLGSALRRARGRP